MAEIEITQLTIQGRGGEALPNRFFRQAGKASELALVLPGLNYTADNPLLYYPTRLLVERGADVLQVRADYTAVKNTASDFQANVDFRAIRTP